MDRLVTETARIEKLMGGLETEGKIRLYDKKASIFVDNDKYEGLTDEEFKVKYEDDQIDFFRHSHFIGVVAQHKYVEDKLSD